MNEELESHHYFQYSDGYSRQVTDFIEPTPEPEFQCEPILLNQTLKLSTDEILDLYNDYHILYQLTNETKFEARAQLYKQALKLKLKRKES